MNSIIFNSGESQNDLRERYNPDGSILRKAQLRMASMLKYLDDVCTQESIPYRIDSGTVLGAVRHGGFIPWDDDVDVVVNRRDFPRLKKYFLRNPHNQFVLQTHKTDPGYLGEWMILRDTKSEYFQDSKIHNMRKYRGLQIDIFPFDFGNLHCLQVLSLKLHYHFVDELINKGHNRTALVSWTLLTNIIYPLFRIFNIFGNKRISSYSYGLYWLDRIPKSVVLPYKRIEFEGLQVMGPSNPEKYLELVYKNYLDLPDIKDRNPHQASYSVSE